MDTKKAKRAAWREANRERIRAYDRSRYPAKAKSECARNAEWRRKNPDKVRAQRKRWVAANRAKVNAACRERDRLFGGHRRIKLGITKVAFDAMLAKQGGRCAVCRTDDPGAKGWACDHDHDTGLVRGALCNSCNLGIGILKDDPARLRAAADYVEYHTQLGALL